MPSYITKKNAHDQTGRHFWNYVKRNLWQCEVCGDFKTSKELRIQKQK